MKTETTVLIIVLIVSALILLLSEYSRCNRNDGDNIEGFADTAISNEALQDIASIYNKKNLAITELDATTSVKTNMLTANEINVTKLNILPRGVIVAWNGTTAPAGWLLCNGQGGTPDLRGKFIYGYGAGQGSQLSKTGGAESVTLNANQIPSHNHRIYPSGDDGGYCNKNNNLPCRLQSTDRVTNDRADTSSGYLITSSVGGNQAHDNMPPYYVLAYIMKA